MSYIQNYMNQHLILNMSIYPDKGRVQSGGCVVHYCFGYLITSVSVSRKKDHIHSHEHLWGHFPFQASLLESSGSGDCNALDCFTLIDWQGFLEHNLLQYQIFFTQAF
uniref:Uncharacterized protein n=1 Tax=Kalanchoe fedtschenkoi TaxID=63787 RepID=A0A7N0SYP1_KALFE